MIEGQAVLIREQYRLTAVAGTFQLSSEIRSVHFHHPYFVSISFTPLIMLLFGFDVNMAMRYFLKNLPALFVGICTNIRIIAAAIDTLAGMVYKA